MAGFLDFLNPSNLSGLFGMGGQQGLVDTQVAAPIVDKSGAASPEDIARLNAQDQNKRAQMYGMVSDAASKMGGYRPQEMAPVQFQENRLFAPPQRQDSGVMNPYANFQSNDPMARLVKALRGGE